MSWMISNALMKDYENSHFSLVQEEEYSPESFSDGEQSAQSSESHTPLAYLQQDRMTAFSKLSRSGTMFAVFPDSLGADLLTWFLEASRARISAQQEKVQGLTGREADYGQKWQGSFAKLDLNSYTWKTAQGSLITDSISSCVTWPRWGLMQNGACYQRVTPGLHMFEKGSGYWHTMTANDCKPAGKVEMAMMQAKEKGQTVPNTYIRLRSQVAARSNMLGHVNPEWVEWLMGWPQGWTDLKPLAMDKFREWQQQHSIS